MTEKKKDSKDSGFSYVGYTKGQLVSMIKARKVTIERYALKLSQYERMFENQKIRIAHIQKQLSFLTDHPWALGTGTREDETHE